MIKGFLLMLIIFVIFSVFVSADKAAYIVKSPNRAEQKYIDILEDMNFTVDVIDNGDIINTNYSEYSFLLVNDDYFSNPGNIPVNKFPSLLLNTYNIDDFHWSSSTGVLASTGILQVYINDRNHFITRDFPPQVGVYINRGLSYYYLPKKYKALGLKTIASLTSDHSDAVIAIAQEGTRLKDNVYSNAKGVFFGIHNHNNWTNYSTQLFRNSVRWLVLDDVPPVISNITVKNRTNESASISWDTDKDSDSSVFYGDGLGLVESNNILVKNHAIMLENLDELTTYYFKIRSCNKDGYCGNSSVFNFTTLDITPPNMPENLMLEVINGDNIKVRWDEPIGGAAQYNIYMADNISGFDFENPNNSTTINGYIDDSALAVRERYYIVRAEDGSGNEERNENIVGKFDLELGVDYGLVSLPLIPFNGNVNEVMHQDESYKPISSIKRFDNIEQEFQAIYYDNTTNEWNTTDFNELLVGEGYFFRAEQDVNFTIVGRLAENFTLEVKEGMNLFGLAALEDKAIADVITKSPVSEIGKRKEDGSYELATYYQSGWYNDFVLEPGIGYWLKANKDFSLMLGP